MRRNTVRFRVTALATAMVALGLIASAVALVLLQRSSLTSSLDQALIGRADDIESLFADGVVPDVFPATLTEGFVQLVGFDGSVMASTPNLAGQPAIQIAESSGSVGDSIANVSGLGVDDDEFRVLTRPVGAGGVLYVGTTFDTVGESVSVLTTSIALVIPPLVVLFAALIWWMVGKTLQPVEDIRSEVSEIGVTDLHRRVPRPGTEDEIDRLAGTMNEMLDRVERSIDRQQRFVADASHELRSPLTRMRTRLELESSEV
ncbi:MAG: HAMP domain-containing protein, partial [Acidimicrobiia bacterium]|nr:HAMP domain-containing protein [Acidimicrobiia bacterium]